MTKLELTEELEELLKHIEAELLIIEEHRPIPPPPNPVRPEWDMLRAIAALEQSVLLEYQLLRYIANELTELIVIAKQSDNEQSAT